MGLSGSTGTRETPILSESSYLGFRDFTKNCAIADPNWAAGVQQSVIVRQMPAMRSVFWGVPRLTVVMLFVVYFVESV